ncbi:MAG: GspE family protein [Hydrogenophaga sp.]|jgi:hypothetical protein|nr:GspE family protein [Hydrogenophaga sp.]
MNEALLTPIVKALSSTDPLDPADPGGDFKRLYVDNLHPGKFGGALGQLRREIQGAEGGHHIYLFSGTVGSGKSTELRRLAGDLRSPTRFVSVVNITDYLNPEQELNFADLLLAMAMGLLEDMAGQFHWDSPAARIWDGLKGLLGAEVGLGEFDLKVVKLNLRQRSGFRDQLRQRFEASPGEFLAQTQRFFEHLAQESGRAQRVLIVDSLEHFGGRRGKDDPILKSLRAVFQEHTDAMRLPGWQTIYSVPPLLPKLAPGVLAVVGAARLYQLTSAHVYLDRTERPDEPMLAQLTDLINRRCGGAEGRRRFVGDAELQRVILGCGGDLRDLLRLLKLAALFAFDAPTLPIDDTIVDAVFDDWRNAYLPLAKDTTQRLAAVLANKEPQVDTEDDWFSVMSDLAEKRVLLYRNGTDWYDVHPLLRDAVRVAAGAPPAP